MEEYIATLLLPIKSSRAWSEWKETEKDGEKNEEDAEVELMYK